MKIKKIKYSEFEQLCLERKPRVYQDRFAYFAYFSDGSLADTHLIETDGSLECLAKLNRLCLETKNAIALKDPKDYTEDEIWHSVPTSACLPETDWD